MISYFHILLVALSTVILIPIWRLWVCVDRLNCMHEVARRAPSLFKGHLLAALFAIIPFFVAAVILSGITLPYQPGPINAFLAAFISAACIGVSLLLLKNAFEYLALTWAGSRVGALRIVAMLRIIDAAELAYALQYVHERETASAGRVIDAEIFHEVRK